MSLVNSWMVRDKTDVFLQYRYKFSFGNANTTVIQIAPQKLLVISPGCNMSEEDILYLRAYGEVVALVAPNPYHHRGILMHNRQMVESNTA